MPVWFVLICGIVLERKKLPEIGKVVRNGKSCPKVVEHLVDSLSRRSAISNLKSGEGPENEADVWAVLNPRFQNGGVGEKPLDKAAKILQESWNILSRETR